MQAAAQVARSRGVAVRGVVDKQQSNADGGEYATLRDAGVDIVLDGNKYLLHHKVFVIDEEVQGRARVITGSFNPTKSADERNDENLLIITDPDLALQFLGEFSRRWAEAKVPTRVTCN